jgi:hypothetical protein
MEATLIDPRLRYLIRLRKLYKPSWKWGAGAEFLYRELIRSVGFAHLEDELLALAKRRPGPKRKDALAAFIHRCKKIGFTVSGTKKLLELSGENLSEEAVAAYRKSRRRPSI